MIKIDPCKVIRDEFGHLFECKPIRNLIQIRTPFTYPDGGSVDLFLEDDGSRVTDFGETLRWLRMQTVATKRTPKQQQNIENICKANGVSLKNGAISINARGNLVEAIVNLAQACVRVSDLVYTLRGRTVVTVLDEVQGFFDDNGVIYERHKPVTTLSQKKLYLDFEVETQIRSFVNVLSTVSKNHANRVIEHALWTWVNLEKTHARTHKFITLLDDTTAGIWHPSDVSILEEHSEISHWSDQSGFLAKLSA